VLKLCQTDIDFLADIVEGDVEVKKRKDLVIDGMEFRRLCFLQDGYAIRSKVLRNGKRQILNVIVPGDIIGLPTSFYERSIYSVTALTDLKFSLTTLESYLQLCLREPKFAVALSWLAVQEAAMYAEHITNIGRRRPAERLAHFLLEMHSRLLAVGRAESLSFELPLSQNILADLLGLSIPHLNRVLSRLRSEKLIRLENRNVEFLDTTALQTLAQYQPSYLIPISLPKQLT
jgi:CRP-like cAMP-binding protein